MCAQGNGQGRKGTVVQKAKMGSAFTQLPAQQISEVFGSHLLFAFFKKIMFLPQSMCGYVHMHAVA